MGAVIDPLSIMKTIVFVCHGNICRSPVGEILFIEEIKRLGKENEFKVFSRATSREEIGNDIYPPMKRVLYEHNIPFSRHYATQMTYEEFRDADYIFYMDRNNLFHLERLFGKSDKYILIRKYIDNKDIEDPWYTDRYEYVFNLIKEAIESIIKEIA